MDCNRKQKVQSNLVVPGSSLGRAEVAALLGSGRREALQCPSGWLEQDQYIQVLKLASSVSKHLEMALAWAQRQQQESFCQALHFGPSASPFGDFAGAWTSGERCSSTTSTSVMHDTSTVSKRLACCLLGPTPCRTLPSAHCLALKQPREARPAILTWPCGQRSWNACHRWLSHFLSGLNDGVLPVLEMGLAVWGTNFSKSTNITTLAELLDEFVWRFLQTDVVANLPVCDTLRAILQTPLDPLSN